MASASAECTAWIPLSPHDSEFELRFFADSSTGLVRELNEDAWLADPPVFVVADGMGGHARGDVASGLVVDAFRDLGGRVEVSVADIADSIERSKHDVEAAGGTDSDAPGSTVVAASLVREDGRDYWLIAHIGDSRAYLWRAGRLDRVTVDHSVVQEMLDAGEIVEAEVFTHPERHVITRAIGAIHDSEPDFALLPVEAGARLLLCSDGLCGEIPDDQLAAILEQFPATHDAVNRLIEAAMASGGHDNITAILIDVVGENAATMASTLGSAVESEDTVRIKKSAP